MAWIKHVFSMCFYLMLYASDNLKLKTMDDIKTILILVEMNDGKVRQVLANKEMKESCLHLLKKDGVLQVTEEIMPIEIDYVAK